MQSCGNFTDFQFLFGKRDLFIFCFLLDSCLTEESSNELGEFCANVKWSKPLGDNSSSTT